MTAKSRINPNRHWNFDEKDRPSSRTIDLADRTEHFALQANLLSEIERAFLQRRFRCSLQLANQVIHDEISNCENSSRPEPPTTNEIQVGSVFNFGNPAKKSRRTFLVNVESKIYPIDQVAAIALQSWHEINASQQQSQNEQSGKYSTSQGYKHLLPFLNLYSSESSSKYRPIPLELMVIFLEFCHAENMIQEAIGVSIDLLTFLMTHEVPRIQSDSSDLDERSNESLNEHKQEILMVFLTRLLPRLNDPELTRSILVERIFSSSPSTLPSKSTLIVSEAKDDYYGSVSEIRTVLKDVASELTRSCWWNQTVVEASQYLDQRLTILNEDESEAEYDHGALQIYEPNKDSDDLLSSHIPPNIDLLTPSQKFWIQAKGALANQLNRIVKSVVEKLSQASNGELGRDQKALWAGKIAFSVALMLLAWRRKRTLRRVCNRTITILLSPLTEVLEALASDPSNHSSIKG